MADNDDPNQAGNEPADDPNAAGDEPTEPNEGTQPSDTDTDWKSEAEKWKRFARQHESQAKKNADKAKAYDELQDQQKTEAQRAAEERDQFKSQASESSKEAARLRVALNKGLTEAQAKRLVGDDEDELAADADELLATFQTQPEQTDESKGPSRQPQERLKPGATPSSEPEETDPRKLAENLPSP